MKRYFLPLFSAALLLAPLSGFAATSADPYADALTSADNQIYQGANAVGAPDEMYATFLDNEATLVLDMGETESGTGDLVVHFQQFQAYTSYLVQFLDADKNILKTGGGAFPMYQTETTVVYGEEIPYRYVRIQSNDNESWKLDAIEAVTYESQTEDVGTDSNESTTDEEVTDQESETPTSPTRGLVVKLVDDGDATTSTDAAVYAIDGTGGRHAFPNETVYRSWYQNDENLAFIDPDNLATYTLRANVTIRPGTYLVKVVTDPKVYAVEPGGVLRWITSEALAIDLYGADWAKRVVDVDAVFFGNYTMGTPIEVTAHPSGTIGILPEGRVVYIKNGVIYNLPSGRSADMRFQSQFLTPILEKIMGQYVDGGDLPSDEDLRWPF